MMDCGFQSSITHDCVLVSILFVDDNASAPKQDQIAIATAVPMPPSVANGSAEPDFGMPRNYTNKTTTTTVRQIQIPKRLGRCAYIFRPGIIVGLTG